MQHHASSPPYNHGPANWPRPPSAIVAAKLHTPPNGARITVAGLVILRQRPGTAKGVIFITLEDETGTANLIIRPHIYEKYRRAARHGLFILAHGTVERQGMVIHTLVTRLEMLDDHLAQLAGRSRDFH